MAAFGTVPVDGRYQNLTVDQVLVPRSGVNGIRYEIPSTVTIYYGQDQIETHSILVTVTSLGEGAFIVSVPEFINPAAQSGMNSYQTPYIIAPNDAAAAESIGYFPNDTTWSSWLVFVSNTFTPGLMSLESDGSMGFWPIGTNFNPDGISSGWPPQSITYNRNVVATPNGG